MNKKLFLSCVAAACISGQAWGQSLFVEAESFANKGGWVVDQQFMDQMGSPYLLAHGMGVPVADASTTVNFPEKGKYYVYVRTYNWTSPWQDAEGPGKFGLTVGGKRLSSSLGVKGNAWMWQPAGKLNVNKTEMKISLRDFTGFDGRCDAIYFTKAEGDVPPTEVKALNEFRRKALNLPAVAPSAGNYDLVVVGGGVAGLSAAVSAARLGCKVALVHDRPVLGGNNSSEVRVHLGGRIEIGKYKELGNLQKEFGPTRGGNAQPGDYYEDEKKMELVKAEKNITLFANYHVNQVEKNGQSISAVIAQNIETGEELKFNAPLFADCTGDGTVGYLAGADFRMGRESRAEFNEQTAPEVADKMTMGASVQWYSLEGKKASRFPLFKHGVEFNDKKHENVTMGEWTWETGMNYNQIDEFERIRDYGLLVVYSNWSYLKNELKDNDKFKKRSLGWVAYVSGKRESRRLMGDYILKEDDLVKNVFHEDGTCATTWTVDLHYPDPNNTKNFPGAEFKSIARHIPIYPYEIPYRCLYSRNVENLFMAGRHISVTHVALGTTRVMRTTAMMGEVVGMAAKLCKEHNVLPRKVYQYHLPALKALMEEGVGKKGLPNNQRYNMGGTRSKRPVIE